MNDPVWNDPVWLDAFEICHYRIKLTESDEILDCTMYAHFGKIHSTKTCEFWKVDQGHTVVREFRTGYRLTREAEEI